ncbi:MAG: BNR-4 repeat-containing protein [Patescibacteria group bacterium]|nr:BNR-4 repeat-containing protein [Patescibacteria group bacterium]
MASWTAASIDGEAWAGAAGTKLAAHYFANPKIDPPVDASVPPWRRSYAVTAPIENRKLDGYRGIWYYNQRQGGEYVFKYSGGLGTYTCKHRPLAIYRPEVNKTFFCYGGTDEKNSTLLHMVSYFDHATGTVPRPTLLVDKQTTDAHDNPVISIDAEGYIFIFSSSHGTGRPSYISRSKRPYDIDEFERIVTTNFSYTQPFHIPGKGFIFPQTIYLGGRANYIQTSPDGYQWSEPKLVSLFGQGHYQISEPFGGKKLGSAFNYHPQAKGLNWRTNLYYMETADFGETWHNAAGQSLSIPLSDPVNPALVAEYESKGRNVYMKDITFDADGHPVVLYLTSGGWESGPANDPRIWQTARWTGSEWDIQGSIRSDNNYDFGSLYIEADGTWRLIGPTETGPQPYNPGGEIALWTSKDLGHTWTKVKQLTSNSPYNHTYARRPMNAHPDFYAIWADGHARQESDSRIYFTNRDGTHVWRLPVTMDGDTAKPEIAW